MILRYGSQGNNPAPCQRHCSAGTVYPVRPILPGSPAPSHVQCDLGGNNNTGSGAALNPWTQLTQIPVHGRLNVRMWRALTCTARGCPGAGASSLSCVLLAPACPKGIARSWAMPPGCLGSGACATGIALPGPSIPRLAMRLPELPPELPRGLRSVRSSPFGVGQWCVACCPHFIC